jgi:hypothetical protein
VKGDRLEDVWDKLDQSQKQTIVEQLKDFFLDLRKIKGTFVGCIDNTACEDQLFTDELGGFGLHENESKFNQGNVTALQRSKQGPWVDVVCEMILNSLKNHEIVLTHGEFTPRNILVQDTKVVAVLDWELSGYYPEYWEYAKAFWRAPWESSWIKESLIDQILQGYFTELAVVWHTRVLIGEVLKPHLTSLEEIREYHRFLLEFCINGPAPDRFPGKLHAERREGLGSFFS